MGYRKAFSLIELMVVIAIIAILSAVAVPAYKSYVINAKYAAAFSTFAGISEKAVHYYQKQGVIPTKVTDIGLPADPLYTYGGQTPTPATAADFIAPPYIAVIATSGGSDAAPGQCANFGIQAYIPDVTVDYNGLGNSDYLQINMLYVDVNGTIEKACMLNNIHNGFYTMGDMKIPGCTYQTDTSAEAVANMNRLIAFAASCP